jgi:probable DNA repair protein
MSLQHNEISRAELFSRLAAGHAARVTVVTPNRRLAQALHAGFAAERQSAGALAWETPDILPLAAFVARLWDDVLHSDLAPRLPALASPAQEQALWEEAIGGSKLGGSLLAVPAAAAQCSAAWGVVHGWRLRERLAAHAGGEDGRAFVEWAGRYERLARERIVIEVARLPDAVVDALDKSAVALPGTLVLFGFDLLSPQQDFFVAALEARGTRVARGRHAARDAQVRRVELGTADEEFAAVARWARARLEANPGARIGIVVPDLARSRARIGRALARVLHPGRPLAAGRDAAIAFDFSLGTPLDRQPVVRDALLLLRLCGRSVAFEEASRLLRSPYLDGAQAEGAARARLDAALRRRLGPTVTLDALAAAAQSDAVPRAPAMAARLAQLADHRRSALFGARPAGEWARAFGEVLRIAAFGSDAALDSTEYQALRKWHEALGEFASLERVCGKMGYGEACGRLSRIVRDTVFQPETGEVPIRVLGILESAGLEMDHFWITGLTEEAWPIPPRPNPFVPLRLQREAGVPNADAASSLALDRRLTQGWLQAAREVVLSHARLEDEGEMGPSPLVASVPSQPLEALGLPSYPSLIDAVRAAGRLERVEDGRAPGVAEGLHRGGTALFRDQAACPFRAFARHRLASRALETPQPGLSAADRGTLLHEMMRGVWTALRTKSALDACVGEALEALLGACADDAIARVRRSRREALSGRFAVLERSRLVETARAWLGIERPRRDFSVVECEQRRAFTFGGVTVDGKLDRRDALGDGGFAVIDYKAGAASIASWLGPRPEEPQVPMYASAAGEDVRAVAFARLKAGEQEFCGLALEEGLLPGVKTIEGNRSRHASRYRGWPDLLASWSRELEALGTAFREGDARVDPKRGAQTCQQCEQQPLCRIAEKAGSA